MKVAFKHLAVLFVAWALVVTGALDALRDSTTDWRFHLAPRKPTGEVAIVAIDASSIEQIGVWPWPRTVHGDLLRALQRAGVADVAFDVDVSSRSTRASDQEFEQALEAFGGSAILPVFKQTGKDRDGVSRLYVSRPLVEFATHAWTAAVNVVPERNGLVRRYTTGEEIDGAFFPSLASLLAGVFDKKSPAFLIDHSIDVKRVPVFSAADVLGGKIDPGRLKDKRIIIGATAIELGDRFHVPVAGIISGVELQALAAESILQRRMLAMTDTTATMGGLMALALFMFLAWRRLGTPCLTFSLLGFAIVIEGTAGLLQEKQPVILDTSAWLVAIAGYLVALWLNELDIRQVLARVAQHRFQSIALSLNDGVVCVDRAGLITFWNVGAKTIFGYCATEVVGRPFCLLYEERQDAGTSELFQSLDPIELVGVRKDGRRFPIEVRFSSWDESDGSHYGAIVRDISKRKRDEERIRYLALHDPLTGLANRTQLSERLKGSVERAKCGEGSIAVLLIDLDNFKDVNDTLGHEAGDRFLCAFVVRLRACTGGDTLVARLGGDEFVVLIEGADAEGRAGALIHSIADIFGDRHTLVDGSPFLISASTGSAVHPRDGDDVDELLAKADLALYRAKKQGRGVHVSYQESFTRELESRRMLEAELQRAIDDNEFELFYQPQVHLRDARIVGAEALIRWRHPVRGLVSPGEFLSVLELMNLSASVGALMLRTACEQGQRWQQAGHDIRIAVNLSPSQFQPELPKNIERVLLETGLAPALLEVEVTENILLEADPNLIGCLHQIRNLGVQIAFDDFGTGYASLSSLKRFPLDRLKIDRSFVSGFGNDPLNDAIVTGVVELAQRVGLSTTAEGIEDKRCAELLAKLGCGEGQGFHFSEPVSADQFEQLLHSNGHAFRTDRAA